MHPILRLGPRRHFGQYATVGEKLALSVRRWTCQDCGQAHDRDVAAAKVIAIKAGLPVGSREVKGVENYTKLGGLWAKAYNWQPGFRETPTAQRVTRQDVLG